MLNLKKENVVQLIRKLVFVLFVFSFIIFFLGKTKFDVEDYSFSQTTLEQVFIEFAKQQEMEDQEER
jgi:hypothetical protein